VEPPLHVDRHVGVVVACGDARGAERGCDLLRLADATHFVRRAAFRSADGVPFSARRFVRRAAFRSADGVPFSARRFVRRTAFRSARGVPFGARRFVRRAAFRSAGGRVLSWLGREMMRKTFRSRRLSLTRARLSRVRCRGARTSLRE
jgi:hypothetical protein